MTKPLNNKKDAVQKLYELAENQTRMTNIGNLISSTTKTKEN